jgi:drug/metabolite transporter (DMT)-like permease
VIDRFDPPGLRNLTTLARAIPLLFVHFHESETCRLQIAIATAAESEYDFPASIPHLWSTVDIFLGLLFALLWSSAPVASKIGLHDAAPLTVLDIRFFLTGAILLAFIYGFRRSRRIPAGREWFQIAILALCNSTLYLGLAWLSLKEITAGVFSLFVAANPFLVALIARVWLRRAITRREWIGMIVSSFGLILATLPLLGESQATPRGLLLAGISVVVYALGSVYFKVAHLSLSGLTLNAWQISIGALLLLPFAAVLNDSQPFHLTPNLVGALLWVVFAVSMAAVVIWFYLLRKDPVQASMWMFLTPVFGYLQAALVLREPIHLFDVIGAALVMLGLLLSGTIDLSRLRRSRQVAALPARHTTRSGYHPEGE